MSCNWTVKGLACAPVSQVSIKLDELLVGQSAVMRRLKSVISDIAPSDAPVLLTGASGTGKEVVAHALSQLSGRSGPMVAVNCGAVPAELLESELFGHEKGAFTGAISRRRGLIEQAHRGTLLLDEIGEMPAALQVKLLRALETRQIQRVGGAAPVNVDFRLISATNRDLAAQARAGKFREDLLYRIEVFGIELPPLCERTGDIPDILTAMSRRTGHEAVPLDLTPEAVAALSRHDWPGNVRELRNFHHRAQVLFAGRPIGAEDVRRALSPKISLVDEKAADAPIAGEADSNAMPVQDLIQKTGSVDLRDMLGRLEAKMIRSALELSDNSVSRAAEKLGLKRTTLIGRMQKLGIAPETV